MSKSITLTVPMPPNIANGSHGHWFSKYHQRKAYRNALDFLYFAGQMPKPPRKPWDKVSIRSVMYLGREMDDDNAMRRHKWVLDYLKGLYIVDDKKKNITWEGLPSQVVRQGQDYRIELTLTPITN